MEYKREHLEALLQLIEKISIEEENNWFKQRLISQLVPSNSQTDSRLEFASEIRRTRAYLIRIDQNFKKEAQWFYNKVIFPDLRRKFVGYYRRMKIAEVEEDFLEYGRLVSVQIETGLNFIINQVDAWQEINRFPSTYPKLYRGDYAFFLKAADGSYINKPLKSISFSNKLSFADL